MLHADPGLLLTIGNNTTVGHGGICQDATIGDGVLVGTGAVILNGSTIGDGSLTAAGSAVLEGTLIPLIHSLPAFPPDLLDPSRTPKRGGH